MATVKITLADVKTLSAKLDRFHSILDEFEEPSEPEIRRLKRSGSAIEYGFIKRDGRVVKLNVLRETARYVEVDCACHAQEPCVHGAFIFQWLKKWKGFEPDEKDMIRGNGPNGPFRAWVQSFD